MSLEVYDSLLQKSIDQLKSKLLKCSKDYDCDLCPYDLQQDDLTVCMEPDCPRCSIIRLVQDSSKLKEVDYLEYYP